MHAQFLHAREVEVEPFGEGGREDVMSGQPFSHSCFPSFLGNPVSGYMEQLLS